MTERHSSLGSGLRRRIKRANSYAPPTDVADIAERFGLEPVGDVPPGDRAFRSMIVEAATLNVLRHEGPPFVEFGNHGSPLLLGPDDRSRRRGYVAIRHGLDLPEVVVDSRATGTVRVTDVAWGLFELVPDSEGRANEPTAWRAFRRAGVKLDHSPRSGQGFHLYCAAEDEVTAAAMASGEALAILTELAKSFGIEIRDGWLVACSIWGDVVTRDDEAWRWVFAMASRLLDLLACWAPLASGPDPALDARATLPYYTDAPVERPKKIKYRRAPEQD